MKVIKQRNKLHREGWILQLKVPQIQSTAAPGPGPSTFCFTNPSCACASTARQAFAKKKVPLHYLMVQPLPAQGGHGFMHKKQQKPRAGGEGSQGGG